jgi:hypothetical protein
VVSAPGSAPASRPARTAAAKRRPPAPDLSQLWAAAFFLSLSLSLSDSLTLSLSLSPSINQSLYLSISQRVWWEEESTSRMG